MAVSPTKSLFLEAVHIEDQAHDAEWLAKDIMRVIDATGNSMVGCVTDNTASNKKAWEKLEEKYPNGFFHGCVSHGLNLFVKDIFAVKKQQEGDGSLQYPADYLFEDLMTFTTDCKEVVCFFLQPPCPHGATKKGFEFVQTGRSSTSSTDTFGYDRRVFQIIASS